MKLHIKNKDVSFSIHVPFWLINLVPSDVVNFVIKHNINKGSETKMVNIDFADIKKSFLALKEFKGLKILEIKSTKGDEITMTV